MYSQPLAIERVCTGSGNGSCLQGEQASSDPDDPYSHGSLWDGLAVLTVWRLHETMRMHDIYFFIACYGWSRQDLRSRFREVLLFKFL